MTFLTSSNRREHQTKYIWKLTLLISPQVSLYKDENGARCYIIVTKQKKGNYGTYRVRSHLVITTHILFINKNTKQTATN